MNLKKLFHSVISLAICICMLIQFSPFALATESASALYLKDLKLIYAESTEDAKEKIPEGYILYEQNINEGTNELGVYICYSITADPAEAITDIRIMNENGNFNRGTFNDKMDQALEELGEHAEAIHKAIVNEFVPNLNNGLPGAKYAYDQLNVFMFDDNTPLGDYIKDGKITPSDISKMLLVCHNTIISAVLSLLAQGLQREEGKDWLDIVETMDPSAYEINAEIQQKYADLITRFQIPLSNFSDQYNIMVYTNDVRDSMTVDHISLYSEDLADEATVQWWYNLWTILNSHMLGGDSGLTAEYLFVEWNLGEGVANHKICMLIDALTEGQQTLMQLIGPVNFILNDIFTEESRLKAEEDLASLKAENGQISLWGGVNTDIFDAEVGITSEAYDEMVTSNNYDIFTKENDVLQISVEDYVSIISNYASIISSGLTVFAGISILLKGYKGSFIVWKLLSHIGLLLTKTLIGTIFVYAVVTVTFLCLLASLIIWIVNEIEADKPPAHDRTTIPKYMIDSVVDSDGAQIYEIYQRVDNVQSDSDLKSADWDLSDVENMSGSDINANKGYNWSAIYISYSESVGNPIEADFEIAKDMDNAPGGYIPLRHFNRKSEAVDLNGVDEYNAEDPNLYLYYKGEKLPEDHHVYKYIRQIQVVNVDLREPNNPDKYRYSYEEAYEIAKKQLTGASPAYYVINQDFSDNADVVTLIGWNGTNNKNDAIKDIRLVYKSSVGKSGAGYFGSITYANMGNINDWSLFISRMQNTDIPPVTTIKVVKMGEDPSYVDGIAINIDEAASTLDTKEDDKITIGWEPVNEFTGGRAVPLGSAGIQLYFMPEKTFTEGPDYLAGIIVDAYVANEGFYENSAFTEAVNCCHVDIWDNDYENYRQYKETECGEHFFDDSVISTNANFTSNVSISHLTHGSKVGNINCPYEFKTAQDLFPPQPTSSVKYNLTKNPYRAIYGLATRRSTDDEMRNSFISYDGYGYAICPIEVTISMCGVYFDDLGYEELLKGTETFKGKTTIIEDREYHSEGIVVNCDITQTTWQYDTVTMNNLYVTGYSPDRTPLTTDDVIFSAKPLDESNWPDKFICVPYMGGDGTEVGSIAPFSQKARVSYWNYSTVCFAYMFTDFYCYFRSEIGTGDNVTTYKPGTGQYVQNIFLASKEKLRTESLLPNNNKAKCENITYNQLETQLVNMGATTTYNTNIGTDYYEDGNDNANTIYLGLTRTDDPELAIRDIRFYVCEPGEKPEKTMTVDIFINGKMQTVEYTLVDDVSLTSKANMECEKVINAKGMEVWEEKELLTERQAYLYVCRNKTAFPNAITEIQITDWCSFGTFEPVLSFNGETIYTVKKQDSVNLHVKDAWFETGDMFSFKREGNNDLYVSELAIHNGSDENAVRSSLIEAGYSVINKDMNQTAAGDHIYIGCKFTDNRDDAITDVMTIHTKNKYQAYSVTDEAHIYNLVADVDLNKGAGGDYIYLYYTKDSRAGSPLLELYGSDSVKDHTDTLYNHQTVRRLWDFKHSNLNAGTTAFTANIYLIMKREGNTGKYISDVMVVYAWSKSGAIEKLRDAGYLEYVDKDLNDGTGSSQWIYLGYKRTDDPDKALRNLLVYHIDDPDTRIYNNVTYNLVSDVNLNRHCHAFSADIFLFYTKDPAAGDPITELYTSSTPVEYKKDERGYHRSVMRGVGNNQGYSYYDLNHSAGGDYIYLIMVSQPVTQPVIETPEKQSYTLTVVGGTSERYTYTEGESVTVTADTNAGKVFSQWTAEGLVPDAENSRKSTYTFTMPANDVKLTAVFTDEKFAVTLPDGAVFVNGATDGQFAADETVQILWDDPETHLSSWIFSQDIGGNYTDNPLTFIMPASDLAIEADTFLKTNEVAIKLDEPIAGNALSSFASYTVNSADYTAEVTWYDGDTAATTAESGKTYLAVITLADNIADKVVFAVNGTATVNGNAAESWIRTENGITVKFSMTADNSNQSPSLIGSIIGNGSWIAIAILSFGIIIAVVVTTIIYKKGKKH